MTTGRDVKVAECPVCRKKFQQTRSDQKYCGDPCRYKAWSATHPRVDWEIRQEYIDLVKTLAKELKLSEGAIVEMGLKELFKNEVAP